MNFQLDYLSRIDKMKSKSRSGLAHSYAGLNAWGVCVFVCVSGWMYMYCICAWVGGVFKCADSFTHCISYITAQ